MINRILTVILIMVFLTLFLVSCNQRTENNDKIHKSDFNLKTDLIEFKSKMTELDTIKIWFDHSVCVYQGFERIEITKESDSIKIKTEFKDVSLEDIPEWKVVYEKKIQINDTIWMIEEFFQRNIDRQKSEKKEYGTLQVSHNGIKIHYFTKDLVDLNRFMADFFETMSELHPENKNGIYGVDLINE
jgi:hypothetical protein